MDAIRIETLDNGKRTGTLISTVYESKQQSDYSDFEEFHKATVIYGVFNKEVELFDVELLSDGDYKLELFQRLYPAAPFVADGEPTPVFRGKDAYLYINNPEVD